MFQTLGLSPVIMSNRKVVSELSKLWNTVASKGKLLPENKVNEVKSWVSENATLSSFQSSINEKYERFQKDIVSKQFSAEDVAQKTKIKVGRLMTTYEELIGMNEVRSAHARVLLSEAKFIDCQEKRRLASKELSDIHNKLMEIRTELDRTQRGDESYLDLIKQEIAATKLERITRKHFEELERAEREVFSELSSALRFSHEKERAQNEKTKYWSVVGSIVGATLGVLGTTINNRMKQNHIKHILEETSSQVTAIQSTVDNLSQKVNENSLTAADVTRIVEKSRLQEADMALQQEKLTIAMQESLKMLQQLIVTRPSYRNEELPSASKATNEVPTIYEEVKNPLSELRWQLATAALAIVTYSLYKFM